MRFQKAAIIDDGFWLLPLTKIDRLVYFYLSSKCQTRWGVSESAIVMVLCVDIKRVRASLDKLEDMHLIKRWRFPRPKCTEYLITVTSEKHWGIGSKRSYSNGSKRSLLTGANAPYNGEQTLLPPTTKESRASRCGDSELLSIAERHFRQFHFGRRRIGDRGLITDKMKRTLVEMMRSLVASGIHEETKLIALMESAVLYHNGDRDVLSDNGRDYRAKTASHWIATWHDQIHRAQSYHEMREKNIVKVPFTTTP